jgi:hypothetical protein
MTPVFERAKTVRVLAGAAAVIGDFGTMKKYFSPNTFIKSLK